MNLCKTACVAAALTLLAGTPAIAQQEITPKPAQAPGVEVERVTTLMVGDRAPELAISEWVKGDEVTGFEEGKVYVVEFWATWCGPCIKGMPHVSKLQKEYKDKGVTIIGVNIWDDPEKVRPFMEEKGGDEMMEYTVAIEKSIEGERHGEMATNWMKAAGQRGIPSAFIVDQRGFIAWIGHPMQMDDPLKAIVAGEWDIAAAAEEFAEAAKLEAEKAKKAEAVNTLLAPIGKALEAKDYPTAYAAIESAMESELLWENASMLNRIAWEIVDPDADIAERNGELGVKLAERAAELTEHKNPAILDTLAWAYYFAGDKVKAVKTEMKAIALLPEDEKAPYVEALERMKK